MTSNHVYTFDELHKLNSKALARISLEVCHAQAIATVKGVVVRVSRRIEEMIEAVLAYQTEEYLRKWGLK